VPQQPVMAKKDTSQMSLFPETLYEYHILLSPSDAIKEDVDNLKQQLHELIGIAPRDLQSIAHITLLKTEGYESMNFAAVIKKALGDQKKFNVKITGHDVFKQGSEFTLYLKVDNPDPINDLVEIIKKPAKKRAPKVLYRQTSIIDKPVRKPKRASDIIPHITIARNIAIADFERIEDFTPFEYENEWVCDRITIRRRIAGTDKHFSPAGEIKLG
jgi:2'-5' RNA ligase